MIVCRIRESSWLARLAARRMGSPQLAMVIGRTIHLHGVSRRDFLQNASWLRHEVCHVRQYRQLGLVRFLWLYLWETWKAGYHGNRFEVAARAAEKDAGMLKGVEIV